MAKAPEEEKEEHVAAEAPAPADADRLWDDAHPFEGSYLIASEENNRQSFQLVNVDMAVVYQVGTSDEEARNAAYRLGDPEAFIQALSGQILVRYLSIDPSAARAAWKKSRENLVQRISERLLPRSTRSIQQRRGGDGNFLSKPSIRRPAR